MTSQEAESRADSERLILARFLGRSDALSDDQQRIVDIYTGRAGPRLSDRTRAILDRYLGHSRPERLARIDDRERGTHGQVGD